MELKYYDKPWLPAFKGAFLILFGIIALLKMVGTIKSVGVLFVVLIAMTGILLIASGVRFEKTKLRFWTIASGIINLAICFYLFLQVDKAKDLAQARETVVMAIIVWLFFYAACEVIEGVVLFTQNNAFSALFFINALLTILFGYFLDIAWQNFTEQGVRYIGLIAVVFGVVNLLSSYMLNVMKKTS
jgi:uncharacterized membrane protein HdeD (DUF308 family)